MGIKLRPYQTDTLDVLRRMFRDGMKRVVLYAPTGSGKTEMGMEMIRLARKNGKRVLFVCNRVELVGQASRRFYQAGIDHGVIQGQNTWNTGAGVLICSIQTLARRGIPPADFILIDEAHGVAGSREYLRMLELHNALPVVGLTATPFSRGLGREHTWGSVFEGIAKATTIRELVDLGFLVDVEIYAPGEPDLKGVSIVAGDYNEKQLGEAVDKPKLIGDIVSHWHSLANNRPTVCFATNIAHSKHITEQFLASGVTAEHIDCYTDEDERKAILGRVASGETRVVSNVGVLAEGWDSPITEVMILARPTRSLIRYIQMAGRILRPFEGKAKALMLDHSGTAQRLGFPTDDLPLELDDGKPKKSGTAERKEPLPKACPKCAFVKPPKTHTCPKCGFTPERQSDIEVEAGNLIKMRRNINKQQVYSELLQIQRERGYSDGWLAHTYRGYTGVWPRGLTGVPCPPSREILGYVQHKLIRYAKEQQNAA